MKKPKIYPLRVKFEIPVSPELSLPRFVYIFIIEGKQLHFIDTGVASSVTQIESLLHKIGRKFSDVKNVAFTHSHPDHIGAAKNIKDRTNANILAPMLESEWILNTDLQFKNRPVPGFNHLVSGSVQIDRFLNNEDQIKLESDITLKAYSTPGHSVGSTSFYFEEARILFSGDAVLLPGELPIFENVTEYLKSLDKIEKLNPLILYSSWDKPRGAEEIPDILQKSREYILYIQKTVRTTVKHSSATHSLEFCKKVLKNLHQNEKLANPLLLKSFQACMD